MKRSVHFGLNYAGTHAALSGCVNDANKLADIFRDSRGYEAQVFTESQCSRSFFFEVVKEELKRASRGDTLLIHQSSHGTNLRDVDGDEPDHLDEALVMWDFDVVVDDEIYDLLATRHRQSRVILVLDTCHSGTASREFRLWEAVSPDEHPTLVKYLPPSRDFLPSRLVPREGQMVVPKRKIRAPAILLAGCREDNFSYDGWFEAETGWEAQGAFSRALGQSLDQQRDASFATLHKSVRAKLPTREYPQEPQLVGTMQQARWIP